MSTKTREIKRVLGFKVGQIVELDGRQCTIKKFPTRQAVVVENNKLRSGDWSSAKVHIREISRV